MTKSVHIIVSGRVQGVFYRASCRSEARRLCLTGWCRNLPDGSVEIAAEGESSDIGVFVRWCEQGPPAADVVSVEKRFGDPSRKYSSFEIVY